MPRPVHIGDLVSAVFGALFVVLNSALLGAVGRLVLSVLAVAAAVVIVVAWVRSRRAIGNAADLPMSARAYRVVVAVEVLALVVGLIVFGRVAPHLAVAWLVLVVGLHFVAFAVWWLRGNGTFLLIGTVMTVLAVAGFAIGLVVGPTGGDVVAFVSGVGSGVLLLGLSATAAARYLMAAPAS